ncbi:MAG: DUF4362 domain-containing protein, partial [Brevinema sp.]
GVLPTIHLIYMSTQETGQVVNIELPLGIIVLLFYVLCGCFVYKRRVALGEGDTKNRIKNVLNYKKPALWVMVVSIIAVVAIGIGLMANPKEELIGKPSGFAGVNATILKIDAEGQTMVVEGIDQNSAIGENCILDWSNANLQIVEADGSIKTLSINDFAVGDTVVLFVDEIQETYPTRATAAVVQLQGEAPLNAMRPMIMVNGILYLDTGKEGSMGGSNAVSGTIKSTVSGDKKPTEHEQSNFGFVGSKYADGGDFIQVNIDDKWIVFEKETETAGIGVTTGAKLSSLPKEYSSSMAEKNGDYVDIHGNISNAETMDYFISAVSKKEKAFIRTTIYTIEGDPIILDILKNHFLNFFIGIISYPITSRFSSLTRIGLIRI